eukprot:2819767-Pleurochrysis_carterae.AAC.1
MNGQRHGSSSKLTLHPDGALNAIGIPCRLFPCQAQRIYVIEQAGSAVSVLRMRDLAPVRVVQHNMALVRPR